MYKRNARCKVCPGTLKCPEIDQIGEYPYRSEVEFNIAVWEYCEKCGAEIPSEENNNAK